MRYSRLMMMAIVFAATLFFGVKESASVLVYDWELIHMDVNNGQNATDLEFTLFQKEHWIEVEGWDYRIQQRAVDGGQLIKEGEGNTGLHDDDAYRAQRQAAGGGSAWQQNDLNHAADVRIDGLDIPFSTRLWLKTSLHLSKWNTLRKRDLTWTFDGNPNPEPPDVGGMPPDEGFTFTDYEPDHNNPGKWRVTYSITNDDPTRWFQVENLSFLHASIDPIDDPEAMMGWTGWTPYPGGVIEVAPLTEVDIILDNLNAYNWIYAQLDKQEIDGSGGGTLGDPTPTIQIHQTVVPEPCTLLLLGTGLAGFVGYNRKKSKKR